MSEKLTDEDRELIAYFIEDKGDLTCWCDFLARRDAIKAELPELWAALLDQDRAEQAVRRALDEMQGRAGREVTSSRWRPYE